MTPARQRAMATKHDKGKGQKRNTPHWQETKAKTATKPRQDTDRGGQFFFWGAPLRASPFKQARGQGRWAATSTAGKPPCRFHAELYQGLRPFSAQLFAGRVCARRCDRWVRQSSGGRPCAATPSDKRKPEDRANAKSNTQKQAAQSPEPNTDTKQEPKKPKPNAQAKPQPNAHRPT